ncbi:flagellar hook-associated protein FlgL [Ramlibacter alkalitolerans]|uniref:Flagellar hook-associated protein FlgL n=1 Tax=Ramlibacter alkalitolerans TaxID=2039631 RepID=A0ABS1JL41_9BURK|nr:flagellar hook-associated protein FlgL [Ramlibacter alkalitolerans]MBL0424851.1 flagellar hook-associated protein FlgL [Ramlibacter alkalitolerans]
MRVPTLHTARQSLATLGERQAEQARLQEQVASGLRVRSPGDDPVAAAQGELARSRLARIAQEQRAVQLAQGTLATADGALAHGVDVLQDAREALVAAGNGGYTADDRHALAERLRSARSELLAVANTPDGGGGFVFGGQGSATAPMPGSTPAWAAVAGEQRVGENARFATTLDGRAAFLALPQGNGVFVTASAAANSGSGWIDAGSVRDATQLTGHDYAIVIGGAPGALSYSVLDTTTGAALATAVPFRSGAGIEVAGQRVAISGAPAAGDAFRLQPAGQQSVFQTLDDAIALLEDDGLASGAYAERLARVQAGVDGALEGLLLARTRAAEDLRLADDGAQANAQQEVAVQGRRSDLRDLDLARGISDLQASQTGLEAALKSYAAVGRKSLFDLIS